MSRRRRVGCWAMSAGCLAALLAAAAGCAGVLAVPAGIRGAAAWREVEPPHDAAPPGRFVRAGDVDIFVLERGPSDGPAVVFVHGSGAWSGTWIDAMEAVADEGGRALALDLPPFGYSERPPTGDYSRPAQAARLLAAVDALGVDRFVLVGHSFGGGPTVEAAMTAPERLDALVLLSVALSVDQPAAPLGPLAARPVRELLVASTLTCPPVIPLGLRHFVHDPVHVRPEVVSRYQRPLTVRGTTPAVADWLPELLAPSPSASLDSEAYRHLDVPTWIVWGAEDTATPVSQAEDLARWLPDAQLTVLDDVGHLPHLEAPDMVAEVLRARVRPAR